MLVIDKVKKAIFHTIGTNIDTYINRFQKKYQNVTSFNKQEMVTNQIKIFDQNQRLIDSFSSNSTWQQFVNCLKAFGLIDDGIGQYIVKKPKDLYRFVNKYIFLKDKQKNINLIRQSRLISLLTLINIINPQNFKQLEIKGVRASPKLEKIKKEISFWEKETYQNLEKLAKTLEEVKKYEFIIK